MRLFALLGVMCAALAAGPGAQAEDGGAVDGFNARLSAFGGVTVDERAAGGTLGLTTPLGGDFGAQTNLNVLGVDQDAAFAGTGHLFWRRPQIGLIGVFGGYANRSDTFENSFYRVGGEGQYYLGRLTLDAAAAFEESRNTAGVTDDDIYVRAGVTYYLTDDFSASVGYRRFGGDDFAAGGVEYQVVSGKRAGLSLFGDARVSVDETEDFSLLAGGRIYISSPKSLIARQREDDPQLYTTFDDVLFGEVLE